MRPRIADQLPADQIGIAAVHRIAEHAFNGVLAEEPEEVGGFDAAQPGILLDRLEAIEIVAEDRNSFAINLTRRGFALIALLGRSLLERRLRKAVAIASEGARQLAVDVDNDRAIGGAGARGVGWKDPRRGGGHDQGLPFIEKSQRDFDFAVGLGLNSDWFAFQSVEQ